MSDSENEIVEEYSNGCRIVRESVPDGEDRYHCERHRDCMKSFDSVNNARLYADVYTIVGGFSEGAAGETRTDRPPAVDQAPERVWLAYEVAHGPDPLEEYEDGIEYVASLYGISEKALRYQVKWAKIYAAEIRAGEKSIIGKDTTNIGKGT